MQRATFPPTEPVLRSPADGELPSDLGADLGPILALVERTWGFSSLRPLQAEAMRAALAGRDALVVLPTGGGKSLCYQAPALLRAGLTVVVSPLISLMKDQIDGLAASGVPAAMLTSAQEGGERFQIERDLDRGRVPLLFVAPERLMAPGFLARLGRLELASVAVDEAHCISHWGHDFRPEYRRLGELRRLMPALPIQAYTATATPRVREDIARELRLRDPLVLVGSFDRPNLTYRIRPRHDALLQVTEVARRHAGRAGIVYCQTRASAERLASALSARGLRAGVYHAGLEPAERKRTQDAFQAEAIDVVVATVAFGMGIDRSDVRFVVHASLPKGVEQYSQETGRAGRDGLPAECLLLYGGSDYHGWRSLIERSASEARASGEISPDAGAAETDLALERLSAMWSFATGATCRHRFLVEFFGQRWNALGPERASCGACDVCLGEIASIEGGEIVAQKILSCVVRCGQRYGAQHVVEILRGAETARIRAAGHDQLSTYGLLREHDARAIRAWIDQLLALGHLRVADGPYPTLFLSRSGVEVLKSERSVTLYTPARPPARSTDERRRTAIAAAAEDEGLPPPDTALFEDLRLFRRELAKERGVPPYVIFNDRTLQALAALKPTTPDAFRGIKGVGDKKAADLGPLFLARIAAAVGSDGRPAT